MTEARPSRDELRAQFEEYSRTRNRRTRNELIEAHRPLATHLARRYANRGEPLDDLVQVASVGLLKAVERFDPERGLEFSTFATATVEGELKRHFRDKTWSVRVPRRSQELHLRIAPTVAELSQRLGRPPRIPEIAQELGIRDEEVLEAMEAGGAYRSASLDAPGGEDREASGLAGRLGAPDTNFDLVEHRVVIEGARLTPGAGADDPAAAVLRRPDPGRDRRTGGGQPDARFAPARPQSCEPAPAVAHRRTLTSPGE